MKLASSWILVRFLSAEPQWELLKDLFIYFNDKIFFNDNIILLITIAFFFFTSVVV